MFSLKSKSDKIFFVFTIFFLALIYVFTMQIIKGEQQFSFLAESFLQGKLYFTQEPFGWGDTSYYQGHYYWPLGPFPALLLVPFVYLSGEFFYQGYLQFFLFLGVFCLCFAIARKHNFSGSDARLLAFAFCFSTVFVGVGALPFSWWYAQVVTVFLLFLAIAVHLYIKRSKYLIIGIIFALLLATRITSWLSILFFILFILFDKQKLSKIKSITILLVPSLVSLTCLSAYNFFRFGNIFEQGYKIQILDPVLVKARDYGIVSLIHLPANIYYFLLATPRPIFRDEISHVLGVPFLQANPWGMSIFITSPIFVYLFFLKYKDNISKFLIVTIIAIALLVFSYYGIGYRQFGYRYSLDFLPFLFYLLIKNYSLKSRYLTRKMKWIIALSALSNAFLLFTFLDAT